VLLSPVPLVAVLYASAKSLSSALISVLAQIIFSIFLIAFLQSKLAAFVFEKT